MPKAITRPTLTITTPKEKQPIGIHYLRTDSIQFQVIPSSHSGKWVEFPALEDTTVIDMITQYSQAQATVRTPDSDGVFQTDMINRGLIANSAVIRDKVYGLLAQQAQFSPLQLPLSPLQCEIGHSTILK